MALVEYIFIDEKKIDTYIEQFRSPVQFEKSSQWKASVSLVGPSGESTKTTHARPMTKHEKIEAISSYLVEKQLVGARPHGHNPAQFIDDSFSARRCVIAEHNIAIWISRPEKMVGGDGANYHATYLIENFNDTLPAHSFSHQYSGYSTLHLISDEMRRNNQPSLRDLWSAPKDDGKSFIRDPMGFLEALGAKVGPERTIRTVYMFRASSTDLDGPKGWVFGVVGYPLWIESV